MGTLLPVTASANQRAVWPWLTNQWPGPGHHSLQVSGDRLLIMSLVQRLCRDPPCSHQILIDLFIMMLIIVFPVYWRYQGHQTPAAWSLIIIPGLSSSCGGSTADSNTRHQLSFTKTLHCHFSLWSIYLAMIHLTSCQARTLLKIKVYLLLVPCYKFPILTFWHNPCLPPRCVCPPYLQIWVVMTVLTRPRVTRPDTECLLMSPIHHQWPGPDKISFKHDQWQPQPTHANSPPGHNFTVCKCWVESSQECLVSNVRK